MAGLDGRVSGTKRWKVRLRGFGPKGVVICWRVAAWVRDGREGRRERKRVIEGGLIVRYGGGESGIVIMIVGGAVDGRLGRFVASALKGVGENAQVNKCSAW
jgi:hypothetical protein